MATIKGKCLLGTASTSPEQTEQLGYEFAAMLQGNETICVIGEIGSGKSTFARGMIKKLFPDAQYKAPIKQTLCSYADRVLHIDGSNFLKTGLPDEFLRCDGIRIIEHGNLWENELDFDYTIKISKENHRRIEIWKSLFLK